jgi:hypothetical protein
VRQQRWILFSILVLLVSWSCRSSTVLLSPLPPELESIEGHASLRLSSGEDSTRSKFTFVLRLPNQGFIEVSDFLGRSIYRIVINAEAAYLVVPSKKAYWKGDEAEIIDKFLGFRLTLAEMISVISGEWEGGEGKTIAGWQLEQGPEGRILSGRRGDLAFLVEEFVEETRFPRSLNFQHPVNTGRLKILKMDFNRSTHLEVFSTAFVNTYQEKTWPELQALLNDAD